jgi:serine/threonine protein kinase
VENYSFSLKAVIGKGSSATVYLGKNEPTNSLVAIKVIDL